MLINLAVLGGSIAPEIALPVLTGAFLPDAPILIFYLYHHRIKGVAQDRLWSDLYWTRPWIDLFHGFHSFVLIGVGLIIALLLQSTAATLFFGSMFLHALADFPLHHKDAHRHFYPLSDWRFLSPVSYWDPARHGAIGGGFELALVIGAAISVGLRVAWLPVQIAVALLAVGYIFHYWAAFVRPRSA